MRSKTLIFWSFFVLYLLISISLPCFAQISPDIYEEDNSRYQARIITVDSDKAQRHNFHTQGDEDWVVFEAKKEDQDICNGSCTYTIRVTPLYNLGDDCDLKFEIYDTDGRTLMLKEEAVNDRGKGDYESHDWDCPKDGDYYVRILNNGDFGTSMEYEIEINIMDAGEFEEVKIKGYVYDRACNERIPGATIQIKKGVFLFRRLKV